MKKQLIGLSLIALAAPHAAAQAPHEAPVAIAPIEAVVLRGGGTVTLVQGERPSLQFLTGDTRTAAYEVANGTLTISCRQPCPRQRLHAVVTAPRFTALAAERRGYIKTYGRFASQDRLAISIVNGGRVDAFRIPAADVVASVTRGGQANVFARDTLTATVQRGGEVQHWGGARVTSQISGNGNVRRGEDR